MLLKTAAIVRNVAFIAIPYIGLTQIAVSQSDGNYHSCNGIFTNKPCDQVAEEMESPLRNNKKAGKGAQSSQTLGDSLSTAKSKENAAKDSLNSPTEVEATRTPTHAPKIIPTIRLTAAATSEKPTPAPTLTAAPLATNPIPSTTTSPTATALPKVDTKATAVAKSKKDLALHDLRMKLIKAKKDLNLEYDISGAVDSCSSKETSLEDCRKTVSTLDEKLEQRITAAQNAKSAEMQAKASATLAAASEPPKSTVVVVQPRAIASPTPLLIFDTGPLYPIEPRYRKEPHLGQGHRNDHSHGVPREKPVPPAVMSGGIVDAIPKKIEK